MSMHLSGPMAISNDRDSHVLGTRTGNKLCIDKTAWTPNLGSGYSTVPVPNDRGPSLPSTSDEEPNAAALPVGHSYAQ